MVVLGLTGASLLAADAPPSLRAIFSLEEFSGAGLDKLSPTELAKLETALAAHRAALTAPAKQAKSTARDFGSEQIAKPAVDTGAELRSRIEGTVTDLSGRSVFVLENGQVWQQRIPDKVYVPRPLVNPEVTLTRGLAGYKMDIEGMTRTIFVKRIQ